MIALVKSKLNKNKSTLSEKCYNNSKSEMIALRNFNKPLNIACHFTKFQLPALQLNWLAILN